MFFQNLESKRKAHFFCVTGLPIAHHAALIMFSTPKRRRFNIDHLKVMDWRLTGGGTYASAPDFRRL